MLEKSLATLFALLILATLINRFLLWRLPERKGGEVTLRIRTWWGIVICFSLVISGPRWMTLTFFALISFLALKEYCTLISIHFPGSDSNLLIVFYVQIMPDDLVMQLHRF
ncbi:CDP-diglyceride synthase [Escherichia coli]|nr:CDP-diglyceride synthase [Escherichia coli]